MFSVEHTEYYGHTDMTYQKSGVCDYPFNKIGELFTSLISHFYVKTYLGRAANHTFPPLSHRILNDVYIHKPHYQERGDFPDTFYRALKGWGAK